MLIGSARRFQCAALGIVLLTVATRLPSLLHAQPINDEDVYSIVANEIVDGGQPYIDAVDRKPPLLFWTYATVFKAAGKFNWKALHAVAVAWTLGTMAGLFVIGRQLFDRDTGLIAALLYGVFQPWATARNLAFNGEMLMNLPIAWAWAIALGPSLSRVRLELLAAGALLCAAFLLKQPAAIAAVPLGIYFLLQNYRTSRGLTRAASVTHVAMFSIGFFGTLGLVAMVLWKRGILRTAFYWTITDHTIPHVFWGLGVLITLAFVGACLPLLIGAAMACRDTSSVWAGKSAERTALLGLLVASAIGTAAGARFHPHYYIQLILPLALLAAPHYAALWSGKARPRYWLVRPTVTYVWLALTAIAFSITHWRELASQRKSSDTGRYLATHSSPADRIFVWGQAPRIYLEAQRRPACRYILTFPLTGYMFGQLVGVDTRDRIIPGAWNALEQDFDRHPPVYIVDVQHPAFNAQYPIQNFPILAKLLEERYRPVARTAEGVVYKIR